MENITIQYPLYFLFFCLLAGGLYAGALYLRETAFREQHPGWHRVMALLRFLSVSLLAVLLLEPMWRTMLTDVRKPVVILAQDESESVGANLDEAQQQAYRRSWEDLAARLSETFDVRSYAFGERVREGVDFAFRDKASDLSELVTMAADQFGNQHLGAMVVASDGIYNQGLHPLYVPARPNAPVFTIGLGDTSQRKDLVLKRVFHNQVAYMGDRFTIQADIAARNCAGSEARLQVSEVVGGNRRLLQTFALPIDRHNFFATREVVLEADAPGVRQYEVSLVPVEGETTAANNTRTFFVDVIDARQKILLLANSPHPDISALRQSLEKNRNYQVTSALVDRFREDPGSFDLVVLHNLPSGRHDISGLLEDLDQRQVPRMFIVGTQTDLARFNRAQPLLTIVGDQRNTNDVQGVFHPDFNLFNIPEETRKSLPAFNPLTAPFGDFQASANAQVLLLQRIGKVDTRYPLLLFGETEGVKTAVLAAEGLWRWRLFDYLQHQDHAVFEALIGSNIQYATLKADKRRFRLAVSKAVFQENEPVVVDAELYNQGLELVNEPDVTLVITNRDGDAFDFTFSRTTRAYTLSAGMFPPGDYTCRAETTYGGETLSSEGKFSIQPLQLEIYESTADHALLRKWGADTGGGFFRPDELDQLGETLLAAGLKPMVYTSTRTRSVIHLKWIFWTALLWLSAEWFLRRYLGGY